jgi:hypothetical protein
MAVTSTSTVAREEVIAALNAEFAGEVDFISDKLDDSLGSDGNYGAVYPYLEEPQLGQLNVWDSRMVIQLFLQWDKVVDPHQQVDPAIIEQMAERLKRALQGDPSSGNTPHFWYMNIIRIEYPDDPTGNKTRLEAIVEASGQNSAIIETSG